MELTLWTYEGPPHIGAMRIASSMKGVHYVLHAPQGDTYADLLFTMIERRGTRPPVTYTTFQARDLGGDTAELVKGHIHEAVERFKPEALLVGESCTAELIQDQPGSLAKGLGLDLPIVGLELPAYSKKENWGAAETLYQLVRGLLKDIPQETLKQSKTSWKDEGRRPRVNLLGPSLLGFRCRDDVLEIQKILGEHGIDINVIAPLGASPADITRLPKADVNICLYPEIAESTCIWLERNFNIPFTKTIPIGVKATHEFLDELHELLGLELSSSINQNNQSKLPWYSKSVDSNYLTGKRVFIFGDGTHVLAAARIAKEELGFEVVGMGTYSREMARKVRSAAKEHEIEALITNDYLEVEEAIKESAPELVLGTQMERHSAKRLGIPCAVISTPMHVQDVPARYSPQMGWEGANVIFDDWVHPLMMGLEEHLIGMFRHDFEFTDGHQSHLGHLGGHSSTNEVSSQNAPIQELSNKIDSQKALHWTKEGESELAKIPFFVRGKVRRNTEIYAREAGCTEINGETLLDAKAHFAK
ncbi:MULTISPECIES: ferredoxin:protochlorophyllide reductase (ATP-dependent) subunit B [unclassified Prochlorococcus]|uniref:ferredoxin:protochlorophyllide reductase (ATP-dependent) subunit B n=1 Tax=unclassified Prochlorococcus TaxID=2627481 RepID=UPI000533A98D|nr:MULTISPECIES: ferredoxin:protochlorophyllide reductase (ATP-dependent) subunit B [unclassified Prochlorococcus]KGG16415.1 Light-independent protochlorophyllide reductase subunit B [Prochlorococcus sp. MIT 0602]KGG17111.1 Light-independent protochlorophyllide reductase subunit B [Prochlorococcus sp. MIT 0603]